MTTENSAQTTAQFDNSTAALYGVNFFASFLLKVFDDSAKKYSYTTLINSQHQLAMPIAVN
jgi:hypothetical protein